MTSSNDKHPIFSLSLPIPHTPRASLSLPYSPLIILPKAPNSPFLINNRKTLGEHTPPRLILDGLESLWTVPVEMSDSPPFNIPGAYRRAMQIIGHAFPDKGDGWTKYKHTVEVLDQFTENWQSTGIAHNDFYDDQMVILPDGKIALVDIAGAGPGDPLLDVGNFLAHLRWSSDVSRRGNTFGQYHALFRREALERFGWPESDLDLREAVCLFRICTNAVNYPREDWRERLKTGLSLVTETLK